MQLELKWNALSIHYNLGGGTHGHLGLSMTNTKSATLSPIAYVRPMHPGILQIPSNTTRVSSYKIKRVYNENSWVFQKVRGVEQALIQQLLISVYKKYIISINNRTTGKFTGNIRDIFAYLLATYGKISPIYLDNFEKEVTEIHYDPVNPVDNIFNKIEIFPSTGTW